MKVAVISTGNNLDADVSPVFGRESHLIIADMENAEIKGFEHAENPARNERAGAGIKAAQYIANHGVEALISGSVGPNAFDVLNQAEIKVYTFKSGTVKDNLKLLSEGQLEQISTPASGNPGARGRGRGGGMGRRR